jgi:hypothetical protein
MRMRMLGSGFFHGCNLIGRRCYYEISLIKEQHHEYG